jgi:hypothetical protein
VRWDGATWESLSLQSSASLVGIWGSARRQHTPLISSPPHFRRSDTVEEMDSIYLEATVDVCC